MNTHSYRLLFLTFAALVLSGCAGTTALRLGHKTYPSTTPDHVRVFFYPSDIRLPYQTIGIITAKNYGSKSRFLQALKIKAAALGADAVIVTQHYHHLVAGVIYGPFAHTNTIYQAKAIYCPSQCTFVPDASNARP
jgi:hypothetical protein